MGAQAPHNLYHSLGHHQINQDKQQLQCQVITQLGQPPTGEKDLPLWRAGLPALGCEAPLMKTNAVYQARLSAWFWGRCAAQRGASPLTTERVGSRPFKNTPHPTPAHPAHPAPAPRPGPWIPPPAADSPRPCRTSAQTA